MVVQVLPYKKWCKHTHAGTHAHNGTAVVQEGFLHYTHTQATQYHTV